ncbi:hypothetical protein [Legionella impletisoli]|uniref:Uncharacterized protein n=1 Tax=Legionella impletisoli TaxID=343510 RepID=A0A917NC34_9GAMM|nr:hypothetical protein [Legionella impletisoli]GGI87389.1 hypothetical protein GCM10007966_15110 [Legionella impletisoli]
MEQLDEQDIVRLKELLRRTGEFIAYFELAETKMLEWRHEIEQKALAHQATFQQQLQTLQIELESIQEIFTSAGLAKFRLTTDNALKQAHEYLQAMKETKASVLKELSDCKAELNNLSKTAVEKITEHSSKALDAIDGQLSQYDIKQFSRIANESCQKVEKSANHAMSISTMLLSRFQWRTIALTFMTTLVTAFAIGLYVSDEFPWENHQHAMNERGAGKLLMNAWPKLTYQEKVKILGEQGIQKV